MISAGLILKAARFLLNELNESETVCYSKYYDGEEKTNESLRIEMEIKEGEFSYDLPYWCLIDFAVIQLNEQGIVDVTDLKSFLLDGEHDYSITITVKGKKVLSEKAQYQIHDVEL